MRSSESPPTRKYDDAFSRTMVNECAGNMRRNDVDASEKVSCVGATFRGSLAVVLDQARQRGQLPHHDDSGTQAERLIAVVDGISLQALFDPDSWPPERQLAHLDDVLADLVGAEACE